MPAKVGIHDFSRTARCEVVDGGPSPAMTGRAADESDITWSGIIHTTLLTLPHR